jgi:hypothetical protein
MLQVLTGPFTSYRDGDEALQALHALGLAHGNGHPYEERKHEPSPALSSEASDSGLHAEGKKSTLFA